ncbi:MAG TPA: zinc ABC transporter substrate-binding protein [Nitrososphaeraceae archaeon]
MNNASVIISKSFLLIGMFLFFISLKPSYASEQDNSRQQIGEKLNVVTSVAPITNIVHNIDGDKINLVGLVPEGINSHTYEIITSNVLKIHKGNLIIIDGLTLEAGIEKLPIIYSLKIQIYSY